MFSAQLADGLHITRMPAVRERILAGTFHNVTCGTCSVTRVVETKTLYTDFERYHWVAVAPPWLISDWQSWAQVVRDEFSHNMEVAAPPMIREMAPRFEVRLVFGLDALAEKLRAWDAGLDDRLVEALKLRYVRDAADAITPGFRLRLLSVDTERWELAFSLVRPDVDGFEHIAMSLDAYTAMQSAEADYRAQAPELFEPPFVGLDRFFVDTLASASARRDEIVLLEPMRPDDLDAAYPIPGDAP